MSDQNGAKEGKRLGGIVSCCAGGAALAWVIYTAIATGNLHGWPLWAAISIAGGIAVFSGVQAIKRAR